MQSDLLSKAKDLLSRELSLCKSLRTMISRELEAIVLDRDMDELLRVLDRKEEAITQLQLLADSWQDTLAPYGMSGAEAVGTSLMTLFPEDEEIPNLLKDIGDIADSIFKAEDEAKMELEKYAAGLRKQLTDKSRGRGAAAVYARMGGSTF